MKKKFVIPLVIILLFIIGIFMFRISINEFVVSQKMKKVLKSSNELGYDYKIIYTIDAKPFGKGYSENTEDYFVSLTTNKIIYIGRRKAKGPYLGSENWYRFVRIDNLSESDIDIFEKYLNNKESYPPKKGNIEISKYVSDNYRFFGCINDESKTSDLYQILERVKNK